MLDDEHNSAQMASHFQVLLESIVHNPRCQAHHNWPYSVRRNDGKL